jgi:hypothetical protein
MTAYSGPRLCFDKSLDDGEFKMKEMPLLFSKHGSNAAELKV